MIDTNGQVYKNGVNITETLSCNAGYRTVDNKHLHKIMMKLYNYDPEKFNSKAWVINHIDLNIYNNSIDNLEYATRSKNAINQKPKQFIDDLPSDCFWIQTIRGILLKNPLIYSPSNKTYYRKFNNKYRIVDIVLTGNLHYIEFVDNKNKFRFVCDNIVGYNRPKPKTISPKIKRRYHTKPNGEVTIYTYNNVDKTKSELKLNALINFVEKHRASIESIKTLELKTNYINTEIPQYHYSASMVYKYAY
jgi:hypothetical protein